MKPILEVHPIQGKILRVLLFQTTARFSQLNPDKVSSDHFNFHLKALLDAAIIEKKNDHYRLTAKGKEFANRFDTEKVVIERQAKLGLAITAVKIVGKKRHYLIQKRLKQPYFGYYGVVTGKIRWGEKVLVAAAREFLEETGLTALSLKLIGIKHKLDYTPDGDLLEDKYFFRVRVDKFSGKLKEKFEGGENVWLEKTAILRLPKLFPDMPEGLKVFDQNDLLFFEKTYVAQGY